MVVVNEDVRNRFSHNEVLELIGGNLFSALLLESYQGENHRRERIHSQLPHKALVHTYVIVSHKEPVRTYVICPNTNCVHLEMCFYGVPRGLP